MKKLITFKTVVRSVKFDEDTEKFFVVTESLTEKKVMPTQLFDYVMVASGSIHILRHQKWVGPDNGNFFLTFMGFFSY